VNCLGEVNRVSGKREVDLKVGELQSYDFCLVFYGKLCGICLGSVYFGGQKFFFFNQY
jgi:hypothetical protein